MPEQPDSHNSPAPATPDTTPPRSAEGPVQLVSPLGAFLQRLRSKVIPLLPIAVGALVIFGLLWLLSFLVVPLLPESWQNTLSQLSTGDVHQLRKFLEESGPSVELSFLGFQVLQVVIAPIPGQLAGFVGGLLFGFWKGLLLTMTGLAIGSFGAILLGRLLGKKVVRRFLSAELIEKFDRMIARGGLWNFFLIYLLPVLPDDAVCFLAGLTQLRLRMLFLVMMLGRLPGMAVLCFVGSNTGDGGWVGLALFGVAMVISTVIWLYSDEVEAWLMRHRRARQPANPS